MKRLVTLMALFSMLLSCSSDSSAPDSEQMVMATLWYQHAAEVRALYYQAFNLAELRVLEALDTLPADQPKAVITDIDETILDNSPSEGKNIREGKSFSPERWKDWTDKRIAKALPGSLEFAKFLESNGVELYYISNRSVDEMNATIDNLKELGFPYTDPEHIILKSSESGKTPRRNLVEQTHQVILLLGDNLADFSDAFDNRSENQGHSAVDQRSHAFGKRFIIFPNPMYGNWTKPLYGSTSGMQAAEIAAKRRGLVVSY